MKNKTKQTKNPQVPTFLKSENFKLFSVTLQTALGKEKHPKHQGP